MELTYLSGKSITVHFKKLTWNGRFFYADASISCIIGIKFNSEGHRLSDGVTEAIAGG